MPGPSTSSGPIQLCKGCISYCGHAFGSVITPTNMIERAEEDPALHDSMKVGLHLFNEQQVAAQSASSKKGNHPVQHRPKLRGGRRVFMGYVVKQKYRLRSAYGICQKYDRCVLPCMHMPKLTTHINFCPTSAPTSSDISVVGQLIMLMNNSSSARAKFLDRPLT